MLKPLLLNLLLCLIAPALQAQELRVAVVDFLSLDAVADNLLARDEVGKELVTRYAASQTLLQANSNAGISDNAVLSENVRLNQIIDTEKQRILSLAVREFTKKDYDLILKSSDAIVTKQITVVDLTSDVRNYLYERLAVKP